MGASPGALRRNTIRPVSAESLARMLADRRPPVVLTGAGVSTESGIPDFRSPTGIWAEFDPLEYASLAAFRRDPAKVWRFYAPRFAMLTGAEPNTAHLALAELERRGLVRAGGRNVVEVHGSIRTSTCPGCGGVYPLAEVVELLRSADAPACRACGAVLKPDVVFFGEQLPVAAIDRAYELARGAGVLLVVGSTLEVWPVAELPLTTLAAGGAFAIVNKGPTALDEKAEVRIDASAGETLGAVVAELD